MKTLLALVAAVVGALALALPSLATPNEPGSLAARPTADSRASAIHPDDRLGARGASIVDAPILVPVTSSASFDWSDAAIGAGAGAGVVLLVLGAGVLVRHGRTEPRTA